MVFQLVYLSYSTTNFDLQKDIDNILNKSRKNNRERDITGMLIYRDELFIQLLEGKEKDIINLYTKIAMDPRHTNLALIIKQRAPERLFPDWSMGFKDAGKLDLAVINKVLSLKDIQENTRNGEFVDNHRIMDLFKIFRFAPDSDKESA